MLTLFICACQLAILAQAWAGLNLQQILGKPWAKSGSSVLQKIYSKSWFASCLIAAGKEYYESVENLIHVTNTLSQTVSIKWLKNTVNPDVTTNDIFGIKVAYLVKRRKPIMGDIFQCKTCHWVRPQNPKLKKTQGQLEEMECPGNRKPLEKFLALLGTLGYKPRLSVRVSPESAPW